MDIEYQYVKDKSYVISRPRGFVQLHDVKRYADTLYNDKAITQPFMEIADFRNVEGFSFGAAEIEELIRYFSKLKEAKGYRGSCLVVEKDFTKSLSNIVRHAAKDSGLVIRTFNTLEDAIKYVQHCRD